MNEEVPGNLKVAVFGASGFVGGELLRLIALHPQMELSAASSNTFAGEMVWTRHPHLRPVYPSLKFCAPEEAIGADFDLAFLALEHGRSAEVAGKIHDSGRLVVDLSADLRLKDPEAYRRWYGRNHPRPDLLSRAVYGLPELHREELKGATLASGVGCNATAVNLALKPLKGLLREVVADVRAGSSEGGARPSEGSHHPIRSRALRLYSVGKHRHMAEVCQEMELPEEAISFSVTAVELVRGVQAVVRCRLSERLTEKELWGLFRNAYKGSPFVSLCPANPPHLRLPDPRWVTGSNHAMIGFVQEGEDRVVVVSVLDNLVKGSAGTAVACANLMVGLPEETGLNQSPIFPV